MSSMEVPSHGEGHKYVEVTTLRFVLWRHSMQVCIGLCSPSRYRAFFCAIAEVNCADAV